MTTANHITVVGNLTRDPELRFTNSGAATTTLGVACSRRYQQNGEWKEETSFMNLVLWNELAENAAATFVKGTRIVAAGRLQVREYEGRDGEKRLAVEVVVDECGPSLRWATAQVERTQRTNNGGGGGSGYTQSPASAPAQRPQPEPYYGGGDEEPF